jgi:hypothetical protein
MSDEKSIKYDYETGISYYGNIQSFAATMMGFAFTATVLVLTGIGDPNTFLSQAVLFVLFCTTFICLITVVEMIQVQMKHCIHSPKPIIPIYPTRNRFITNLLSVSGVVFITSIPVMFLLRNLIQLFVLAICVDGIVSFLYRFYRWKPMAKEWESVGLY